MAKGVRNVLERAVDVSIGVLVTLFLLFYFLRDKRRILRVIAQSVPLAPNETAQVRDNIRNTISAVVFGTLAVAVVQGLSAASCSGGSACPRRSCGARSWRSSRSCRSSAPR